jgi:tetratricopeptide (TPR) repeat protein
MRVKIPVVCWLLLWCAISALAQQDSKAAARAELDSGTQAFNEASYESAIGHFEQAISLDPRLTEAHLYLAATYAQMFVPGVDTPENVVWATRALNQYSEILEHYPSDIESIKGKAYLYLQLRNFAEAKENYKKAITLNPKDPELFYAAGVADWSIVERDSTAEKAKLDAEDEDALISSTGCADLRAATFANVEEGIAMLTRATALRQDYDDAMTYLNLLYRLRADMQCGNKQAQAADLKKADDWAELAAAAKKKRVDAAAKSNQDSADTPPPR